MGIKSTEMGEMGILFLKEISTPSDSYQINSNLQMDFTVG